MLNESKIILSWMRANENTVVIKILRGNYKNFLTLPTSGCTMNLKFYTIISTDISIIL